MNMQMHETPAEQLLSRAQGGLSWRQRVGSTGVILAFFLNLGCLALSLIVLGKAAAWLSPERTTLPAIISDGIPLLQFVLLAYLLDQLFRFFVRRWAETQALGRPPPRLGLQLGRLLIYFCFAALSLSAVFNRSVTGILAASGVVGLVAGFALRGLVSDLFFGIALHIDRNISIGDWVDVGFRGRDISGQVHDIHWRSVILHDASDNVVLIPNSEFASSVIINRSKPLAVTEYSTTIALGHEYECGRVMTILDMVLCSLRDDQLILPSPPPRTQIGQIDNGVIRYRITYSVEPGRGVPAEVQSIALHRAIQYLRAAGCYFYPLLPNYINPEKPIADRPQDLAVRQRVVANVPLFRVLPTSAIDLIVQNASVEIFPAGSVLIRAGEPGNTMWVLGEGSFDVSVKENGEDVIVTTLWPGDWVGEMALLTGEPRSATVTARTPALVYRIDKPIMEMVFNNDNDVIMALAQIAGRRRKKRSNFDAPLTLSQENAKTSSTVARIRAFFGIPAPV